MLVGNGRQCQQTRWHHPQSECSGAAPLLKDTVNRIGDLMDDGQPNPSFKN